MKVRVSIIYEKSRGCFFDFDYYINVHMKLTMDRLSNYGLSGWQVQQCKKTLRGEMEACCMTHLDFTDPALMQEGFDKHGEELQMDFENYTNIEPKMLLFDRIVTCQ